MKKYRHAIAAFIMMMAVGIPSTALSFFVQPVSTALGVGQGQFTLYYSILVAAGAFSAPFIGQFVGKNGVRKIVLIGGIWGLIGYNLFSFSSSVWMFYLIAALTGIMGVGCMSLSANVTVQTNYDASQAASLLGIVVTGSAISSVAASAAMPKIIAKWGWNIGYRTIGITWFVLAMLAVLLLGKGNANQYSKKNAVQSGEGMTRKEALASKILYLFFGLYLLLCFCSAVLQYVPSILTSYGYNADKIAAIMALCSLVGASGKILQGKLYGKAGFRRGGILVMGIYMAGFIMLNINATAIVGLYLVAFGMGINTTYLPLFAKSLFGAKEYAAIWGLISMIGSIGAFIATPLWGVTYDISGGYFIALVIATGCLVGTMLLQQILLKLKK